MFQKGNKINVGRMPWNKGKKGTQKVSKETRRKLSRVRKGNKNAVGMIPWNKGKTNPYVSGNKHWAWKGGVAKGRRTGRKYRQWRSDVFQRDNWTCQTCRVRGVYLEAHHIKSWVEYPKLRYDIENGVALCKECHELTDNFRGKNHGFSKNNSNGQADEVAGEN